MAYPHCTFPHYQYLSYIMINSSNYFEFSTTFMAARRCVCIFGCCGFKIVKGFCCAGIEKLLKNISSWICWKRILQWIWGLKFRKPSFKFVVKVLRAWESGYSYSNFIQKNYWRIFSTFLQNEKPISFNPLVDKTKIKFKLWKFF